MSEETNKKVQETPKNSAEINARPVKRTYSKEVLARARRIQAVRKAEESKKASEERKMRMAKRAENKKKQEDAKKVAAAKKTTVEAVSKVISAPKEASKTVKAPVPEIELIEFAVTARKYKTQLTRKFKERKFWVDPSPFEILSYIPGTIISVDVKVGKIVEEGQQLLILEAMKMQNRVDMPFTARIKKINVKAGERIPKDFVMIELEPVEK